MINISLPFPPAANRYWRKNPHGGMFVSKEARVYRDGIATIFDDHIDQGIVYPVEPVALIIVAYCPSTNRDLDSLTKVLFDALQGHLYEDDVQVHRYLVTRHEAEKPKRENARIVLYAARMEQWDSLYKGSDLCPTRA